MCGNRELDLTDSSSDEETQSLDSFRSQKTEKKARNWAYCILICYTIAAIAFMAFFIIWFTANKSNKKSPVQELETEDDY